MSEEEIPFKGKNFSQKTRQRSAEFPFRSDRPMTNGSYAFFTYLAFHYQTRLPDLPPTHSVIKNMKFNKLLQFRNTY